LSQFEQAGIIGDVIGRALRYEEISPEEARKELLTMGPLPAIRSLYQVSAMIRP
jgi:hypothetical protein